MTHELIERLRAAQSPARTRRVTVRLTEAHYSLLQSIVSGTRQSVTGALEEIAETALDSIGEFHRLTPILPHTRPSRRKQSGNTV